MTRRRKNSADRPHQRFTDWLLAGSSGEPPRDVAVHAASCPECQARIAAMDELAMVDLGLAGMPDASTEAAGAAWPFLARRAAMAASALAAVLAVAFIGWRIFLAPDAPIGVLPAFGASPNQEVLGGTSSQQPTLTPGGETLMPSPTLPVGPESPTAPPTLGPPTLGPPTLGPPAPGQTPFPPVFPTIGPAPTPVPSVPGVTPRPTTNPTASVRPTPPPPTPPPPTPPPPTPPPPTPPPTAEPTPSPLDDCADGIDNDGDLLVDLLDPGCLLAGDEPAA